MMSEKDLYACLGVERTCGDSDIRKAYRRLAMVYHPDKNKNDADKDKFKEIAHAYDILSDSEKRYKYDQESVQSTSRASTSYSTHFSYAVQKQYHQRQKQQQQQQQRKEESKKPKKTRPRRPQQNPFKKSFFDADDFFGSDAASRKEEK